MKLIIFTLTFILFRVVATDTVVAALDDEVTKFSSIIITAPGAAAAAPPHMTLELPSPMRKYKAEGGHTEPFGYGRLFTYNTDCDFGDISIPFTHRNILERLREYKETEHGTGKYEDSNLLLVRVRFTCITPTRRHSFECFFSLFSSGVTRKYDCKNNLSNICWVTIPYA